jgi:glycosyltransferase involved in cell wall biosynthesis
MPRRCLFVIHYPVFGGPHNQALRLAPTLRSLGWETVVLIPDERGNAAERLRAAGIQTLEAPLGRLRASADPRLHLRFVGGFPREVRQIRSLIRELEIDLVLLGGLVNPHGAIAGRLERLPIVWQILDTLPPPALRRGLMPLVTRLAGAVMCTGETVARAHPGAVGLGERLVLFFPPVDVELFRPDPAVRSRARNELGLSPDEPVVGTVGNLTPMKDHATLVRAAAVLHRIHPRARFAILGSSYEHRRGYADELLHAGEELGLQPHRDLILRDPGERVAELAQAFDVFWLSSRSRSEGLPTVLGEAMALGLPVVATRVGSVAEAVGGGGLLVPPSDPGALARAAAQLIEDPSARSAIGEEGRRWASEKFSVEASAAAHLRAFEIACDRASPGGVREQP